MTIGNITDSNHLIPDPQYQAQQMANDLASQINRNQLYNGYIQAKPITRIPPATTPTPNTDWKKLAQQWNQQPKTFVDTRENYKQQFKMENFKTPVHELLDSLFTIEEMEEYLESMDYRKIPGSSYLVKGEPDPEFKRTFTVTEAFYAEMTIKLKNTLLAKGQLKLKI